MSLAGRLASRVPRFATIELQDSFKIKYLENSNVTSKTNSDSIECSPDEVTQDAEKTVAGEGNNPNVKNKKKRSVAPQTQVQATLNNGSEDTLITPKSDLTIAISKAELSAGY